MATKLASRFLAALACVVLALLNGSAIAAITIQSVDIVANTKEYGSGNDQHFSGINIPIPTATSLSSYWGGQQSLNTIDFSTNSGQTILSITIDSQVRNTSTYGFVGTFAGAGKFNYVGNGSSEQGDALRFSTNVNTPYELSGIYSLTSGSSYGARLTAQLYDVTANQVLFYNNQISNSTPNEILKLGETGGDNLNELSGNLTGMLQAGHVYEWAFGASSSNEERPAYSTATGNFKLVLGEVTQAAVPEAASAVIWLAVGLTATNLGNRRRERN